MSGENYAEYFDEIASRSLYSTGIDVNTDDKILTLSTCTRDMDISTRRGVTNARCVLVARLIRDGESEEVDTSLATVNENRAIRRYGMTNIKKQIHIKTPKDGIRKE